MEVTFHMTVSIIYSLKSVLRWKTNGWLKKKTNSLEYKQVFWIIGAKHSKYTENLTFDGKVGSYLLWNSCLIVTWHFWEIEIQNVWKSQKISPNLPNCLTFEWPDLNFAQCQLLTTKSGFRKDFFDGIEKCDTLVPKGLDAN